MHTIPTGQPFLALVLLAILAWTLRVLLDAHRRGMHRVHQAEVRELLAWQDRDPQRRERRRSAIPMADLPPHVNPAHPSAGCAHGVPWTATCFRCRTHA